MSLSSRQKTHLRGGKTHVVLAGDRSSRPVKQDPALIRAVARGFRWREQLLSGKASSFKEIAQSESINAQYVVRILRLAFLAPDITEAILAGR